MNIDSNTRLTDELERQLLESAFEEQYRLQPLRFFERFLTALKEMSRDLVAARAKCTETQLV